MNECMYMMFLSLCLCSILNDHCQFQIHGKNCSLVCFCEAVSKQEERAKRENIIQYC